MLVDLTEEIVHHCSKCSHIETSVCKTCFFATVDFGKLNLGSKQIYRQAYHYLRTLRMVGYKCKTTFGTHLNIKRKVAMK